MRAYHIYINEYLQLFTVWCGETYLGACSPMRNQTIKHDETIHIDCENSEQAFDAGRTAVTKQNEPAPVQAPFMASF